MSVADMNTPTLQDRAKRILIDPKSEWPLIEREPTTVEGLYRGYIAPLAAIPALATFIGLAIVGQPLLFAGWYRHGVVSALGSAILLFVLTLIGVYVAAFVINKLAPTFESVPNDIQALKLVAYAYTPAWIAGVLNIIPVLGILAFLGSLYSIYLFYLGLPVMMKTPPSRVVPYMLVSAVVIVVLYFITAMIAGLVLAGGMAVAPRY